MIVLNLYAVLLFCSPAFSNPSMVADINNSPFHSLYYPFETDEFIVFNSKLYFQADDGINGKELWVYDGVNPPAMVADINTVSKYGANPVPLTVFNSKLYFKANDGAHGEELWAYDGVKPPAMVMDINPEPKEGSSLSSLIVFNSKLYFRANNGNTTSLWVYDGLSQPNPIAGGAELYGGQGMKIVYNSKLYYHYLGDLWSYDGVNPPVMVADIWRGQSYADSPNDFVIFKNKLYFFASSNKYGVTVSAEYLFVYDGTNPPSRIASTYHWSSPVVFNNKLYFSNFGSSTDGAELWVFDGVNPPALEADVNREPVTDDRRTLCATGCSYPRFLTVINSKLYFSADDGIHGRELWVYDGTNPPSMVADIRSGYLSSDPSGMAIFDSNLYFEANDGIYGAELWAYKPPPVTSHAIPPILDLILGNDQNSQ